MNQISEGIQAYKEERKKFHRVPKFTPAGQSTQLIVGATPESDWDILQLSSNFYHQQKLKRVYYSGYLPVNEYDKRLPTIQSPPLVRENRLYQSDWLMRFYEFSPDEILTPERPFLDLEIDPKLAFAIRNLHLFPVDINKADYHLILRVPGIGVQSARMIVDTRRFRRLTSFHLKKIGVVMKRAQYFITCNELPPRMASWEPERLKNHILAESQMKRRKAGDTQLMLFPPQPSPVCGPKQLHFKN